MIYFPQDHTFVICAYKESPFLEEAIASVKAQTMLGSVLVATSTPNDHITNICVKHHLPLVVNTGESSIALDWNFGYDQAETKLVTLVHQDDVYEPTYLERVLEAFNSFPGDAGLAHTDYFELRDGKRVFDNRLLKIKRTMNKRFSRKMATGSPAAKRRGLAFGDCICCPSVTFDKTVVGPSVFDTEYANSCDYRTWVDLATRSVAFLYVNEFLMGHRIYAESTTTANIENDVRTHEDREIMASLWPKPIANLIFSAYKTGQKSNDLQ